VPWLRQRKPSAQRDVRELMQHTQRLVCVLACVCMYMVPLMLRQRRFKPSVKRDVRELMHHTQKVGVCVVCD